MCECNTPKGKCGASFTLFLLAKCKIAEKRIIQICVTLRNNTHTLSWHCIVKADQISQNTNEEVFAYPRLPALLLTVYQNLIGVKTKQRKDNVRILKTLITKDSWLWNISEMWLNDMEGLVFWNGNSPVCRVPYPVAAPETTCVHKYQVLF